MKLNRKKMILAVVALSIAVIFAVPYLGKHEIRKFTITPHPVAKLQEAAKNGKPVFLEFYSPK